MRWEKWLFFWIFKRKPVNLQKFLKFRRCLYDYPVFGRKFPFRYGSCYIVDGGIAVEGQ